MKLAVIKISVKNFLSRKIVKGHKLYNVCSDETATKKQG